MLPSEVAERAARAIRLKREAEDAFFHLELGLMELVAYRPEDHQPLLECFVDGWALKSETKVPRAKDVHDLVKRVRRHL